MLQTTDISMHYGNRTLYEEVNLNLNPGKRYALVGGNGAGKTTFINIIAGTEKPSGGSVSTPKDSIIGWLKQDQFRYENERIIDVVLHGKPALWDALQEKEKLLNQATFDEAAGIRLAELEATIAEQDGYVAEATAGTILSGLGIDIKQHNGPLSALSGGFKLRVLLAQALFQNPDILLLDEPTNHLDIMSIVWLEQYLKETFKGILVFISHDRGFLNSVSTHVLDIDYQAITQYVGNYDSFLLEKATIYEQKLKEHKGKEKKVAEMQKFVDRFGAKASKAKQAASRVKMIEKIDLSKVQTSTRRAPYFVFKQKRPSGKQALKIDGIAKRFGEKQVLKDVKLDINRSEKIAIIGHNGIGKSTLLKILLDKIKPDAGKHEWGHEAHVSYFAQDHHEALKESTTVYDWLCKKAGGDAGNNVRNVLGQMLFQKDDVQKNILSISGGEAARLLLAQVILEEGNVLVLDEPTNHLDLESTDALADALAAYPGTVILVSHNQYFVSKVATRVLAFSDRGIKDYHGSYQEYLDYYGADYLNREWVLTQQ